MIGEIYFTNVDLIQKELSVVILLALSPILVSASSWTYSFNKISV